LDGHAVSQTVSVENDISLDVLGFISGVNERPIEKTRGWDTHRAATLRRGSRSRCASQRPRNEGREARWYRWCCSWSRSVKPRLLERQRPATWRQARKSWCSCGKTRQSNPFSARGLSAWSSPELRDSGRGFGRSVHRSGSLGGHFGGRVGGRATHVCDGGCSLVSYVSPGTEIGNVLKGRPGGLYFDVGVDGMEIVTIVATVALNRLGHDSSMCLAVLSGAR